MNVLGLAAGPGGAVIEGAADASAVRAGSGAEAGAGWSVGIRPEHIRIATGAGARLEEAESGTAATVQTCEYFGSDTILGCLVGNQHLAVRAPGRHTLAPSTAILLRWSRSSQHFFDPAGVAQPALP